MQRNIDTNNPEVRHQERNSNVLSTTLGKFYHKLFFKYKKAQNYTYFISYVLYCELVITLNKPFLQKKIHLYIYIQNH